LFWWLKVCYITLTVTNERVTIRTGILSKYTNEVYHTDIRNVQVRQGLFQRIFKAGSVGISSAGTGQMEISVNGIPNPEKVKALIDQYRKSK
jgi:uncharacterized membrane protein YdbT with pleckstrin-like domain